MPPKRLRLASSAALGGHNALWIQWLEEDKLDAMGTNLEFAITKAQRALVAHPHPITSPHELLGIKFFGTALVNRIRRRCKRERLDTTTTTTAAAANAAASGDEDDVLSQPSPTRRQRQPPEQQQQRRQRRGERPSASFDETGFDSRNDGQAPLHAGLLQPTFLPPVALPPPPPPEIRPNDYSRDVIDGSFCFTYCDEGQNPVASQDKAQVIIEPTDHVLLYAVLFRAAHQYLARQAGVMFIEPARSERFTELPARTHYGFLPETSSCALESPLSGRLPPLVDGPTRKRTADPSRSLPYHVDNVYVPGTSFSQPVQRAASSKAGPPSPQASARTTKASRDLETRTSSAPARAEEAEYERMMDLDRSPAPFPDAPQALSTDFPLLRWSPNTYDIVCLIDTREVKDALDRGFIADELKKRNVNVETRSLQLGDTLWIARRRMPYRENNGSDEVALDFIVERKRLDDLVSSVKGGRYHEQKFRLKKSGITNVFFVIETAKKDRKAEVVDEFFVHQTVDAHGTVEILKTLHEAVCDRYRNQNLYIIPPDKIHRDTYETLQNALSKAYPQHLSILTTFESFNRLNAKSTFQTAKEVFAKQLLCIRGMSAERASYVVERYGTLRALWEAFREAEIRETTLLEKEMEEHIARQKKGKKKSQVLPAAMMLAELGVGRRRIGKQLSQRVYRLFRDDLYQDGGSSSSDSD